MLLADFGTSYTKLFTMAEDTEPRIVPTRELDPTFMADLATAITQNGGAGNLLMS